MLFSFSLFCYYSFFFLSIYIYEFVLPIARPKPPPYKIHLSDCALFFSFCVSPWDSPALSISFSNWLYFSKPVLSSSRLYCAFYRTKTSVLCYFNSFYLLQKKKGSTWCIRTRVIAVHNARILFNVLRMVDKHFSKTSQWFIRLVRGRAAYRDHHPTGQDERVMHIVLSS